MKVKAYEHLLAMNRGFDQVVHSLRALAKYPALNRNEIRRFEQLTRETCARPVHISAEVAHAGRPSRRPRNRERGRAALGADGLLEASISAPMVDFRPDP